MIVGGSAFVALIEGEETAGQLVVTARHGPATRTVFNRLPSEMSLGVDGFTDAPAPAAQRTYRCCGKGPHPAGLNFGDCITDSAAELVGESSVGVGNDLPRTDLEFGGGIVGYPPGPVDLSRTFQR
ncbi:type II toxin-antitoxin system VapC family toxin [Mycobacterium camsae]|uniref:type II toxin-antitoxin system VapC family toxin n=1 Tax=Mycobacterium gordonae TaxID=1778 RepID=UPI001F11E149|nr:type II toxin-antitoxin system VapC family toxin [Mycobacterium gordonae]